MPKKRSRDGMSRSAFASSNRVTKNSNSNAAPPSTDNRGPGSKANAVTDDEGTAITLANRGSEAGGCVGKCTSPGAISASNNRSSDGHNNNSATISMRTNKQNILNCSNNLTIGAKPTTTSQYSVVRSSRRSRCVDDRFLLTTSQHSHSRSEPDRTDSDADVEDNDDDGDDDVSLSNRHKSKGDRHRRRHSTLLYSRAAPPTHHPVNRQGQSLSSSDSAASLGQQSGERRRRRKKKRMTRKETKNEKCQGDDVTLTVFGVGRDDVMDRNTNAAADDADRNNNAVNPAVNLDKV